jgi:hypothetical protein
MARASLPFLVVVAMAVFIVTYNTVTMLMSYQKSSAIPALQGMDEVDDGRNFFNPLVKMPDNVKRGPKRLFHVAVTANDSPYNRWQTRIMYYWYKKFKDDPLSEMGGFTRILHSGKPDNVMDEIPTVVVDPLPEGEDRGYVVLNRPWAFVQWLRKANIEEEYVCLQM